MPRLVFLCLALFAVGAHGATIISDACGACADNYTVTFNRWNCVDSAQTPSSSADLDSISVRFDHTWNTDVSVVLYEDSGTQIDQTNKETVTGDGFHTFDFASTVAVSSGTSYKICVGSEDEPIDVESSSGSSIACSGLESYASPPDPFPACTADAYDDWSWYAEGTATGGSLPPPDAIGAGPTRIIIQ